MATIMNKINICSFQRGMPIYYPILIPKSGWEIIINPLFERLAPLVELNAHMQELHKKIWKYYSSEGMPKMCQNIARRKLKEYQEQYAATNDVEERQRISGLFDRERSKFLARQVVLIWLKAERQQLRKKITKLRNKYPDIELARESSVKLLKKIKSAFSNSNHCRYRGYGYLTVDHCVFYEHITDREGIWTPILQACARGIAQYYTTCDLRLDVTYGSYSSARLLKMSMDICWLKL